MARYPELPYVQAGANGGQRTKTPIFVIHSTENDASAASEANYMRTRPDGVSVHFFADTTQVIQTLDTDLIAYGCYPTGNSRSVQLELCGFSNRIPDATLRKAASIVRKVCQTYGIPLRKITPQQMRNGERGICGHWDVTQAWGEGDHTDPGKQFPWPTFIGYINGGATVSQPVQIDMNQAVPRSQRSINDLLTDVHIATHVPSVKIQESLARVETGLAQSATRDQALAADVRTLLDRDTLPIELEDADITAIAEQVAARITTDIAAAVADELARRLDPRT